ncbi:MAG TPA: Asp-tRNA(Asn)/Glu-tRNA(Gln) amidotransferase subunit GatC [Gemmatimonadales bacterium]|jgi:aspartyl-tRNA(Asn)/glutamyl-tRNA(Gln) amidotransferase subunit C
MKIGAESVRHVARLAELAVADDDIEALAGQLESIVNFVAQLADVAVPDGAGAVVLGPDRMPLRADRVDPIPMTRAPAAMAPAFEQGFFIVPRLDGMAGE